MMVFPFGSGVSVGVGWSIWVGISVGVDVSIWVGISVGIDVSIWVGIVVDLGSGAEQLEKSIDNMTVSINTFHLIAIFPHLSNTESSPQKNWGGS